jgi:hypothetical protein
MHSRSSLPGRAYRALEVLGFGSGTPDLDSCPVGRYPGQGVVEKHRHIDLALELVADDRVAALLELDPTGLLAAQAEPGRSEAVAGIDELDAAVVRPRSSSSPSWEMLWPNSGR